MNGVDGYVFEHCNEWELMDVSFVDKKKFGVIFFQGVLNLFLFPIFVMGLVHKECPTCQRNIFLCDVVCKYCKNIVGVKTLR